MHKPNFISSRSFFLTCFMLVLVVFSTTMRFASIGTNRKVLESNFSSLLLNKNLDKNSTTKQEKEPLTLKTTHASDALLQTFVTTEIFQSAILTASLEFVFPSFSFDKINSISYYFSSSSFFKTLFSCFISPNAP